MSTAILVPVMRVKRLGALIENIHAVTPQPHRIMLAMHENLERYCPKGVDLLALDKGGTWGQRLNYLYAESTEDYVFCGADDVLFHKGWLKAALYAQGRVDGVVMVNDLIADEGTLPFISRNYLETMGGTVDGSGAIIHEDYWHCFSERELVETAKMRGRYAYCPESVVEHLHWMAGKASHDDLVYKLGDEHWNEDATTYSWRMHLWQP